MRDRIKKLLRETLKETSGWTDDKDSTYWSDDSVHWGSDKLFSDKDPDWDPSLGKGYWKQGPGSTGGESSGGGEETVTEDEEMEIEDDPFSWLRDSEVHPNYNGHPQGVVYLYDHDEIDEFCDIIENYNGGVLPRGDARHNLHNGLEYRRNDLEVDGRDISEAVLSASFFVERKLPGVLSVGYWDYDVDHEAIREWFQYDGSNFNEEYRLYTNLNDVRKVFEDYQNPEL